MPDFKKVADDLVKQVQAASIDGATEVNLVLHGVTERGDPISPMKVSMTPVTTVRFPGRPEEAQRFAAETHRDAIIMSVRSVVGSLSNELIYLQEAPCPMRVLSAAVEIVQM